MPRAWAFWRLCAIPSIAGPIRPRQSVRSISAVAESKNSKELGRCRLPPHEVPRESGANDGETVPRRAEIVDDAVLRQLDRTFVSAFNALVAHDV